MRLRFIGILAVLAMIMAFAAAPVAAATIHVTDHTLGEGFENPCGTNTAVKLNEGDIQAGVNTYTFEGLDLVLVLDATFEGGELDSVEVVSVSGGDAASIFVHAGEGTTLQLVEGLVIDPEKGISFVLFCIAPPSPTLSLEKVITGGAAGDDEVDFDFTLSGDASGTFMTDANDPALLLASASGTFTITESAESGWTLSGITCNPGTIVSTTATSITVTVGANEDVVCTFTNGKVVTVTELSPTLSLDKVVTSGNANTEFAFTWGAQGGTMASIGDPLSANDPVRQLANVAGTYVITEAALGSEWSLTGITCAGNAAAASVNLATQTVTVTVGADEDVVCTFTNAPQGTQGGGGAPGGGTAASQAPTRAGTLASSLPNTAMDGLGVQIPALALAIALVASLGYMARRASLTVKNRE